MDQQLLTPHPDQWPAVRPEWSHTLQVSSRAHIDTGSVYTWHYLDNLPSLQQADIEPVGIILAVHGNPTWSYLWRSVLEKGISAENPWRVVAVDQLDMGYSERTGTTRRLADRVQDLADFTAAVGIDDTALPVVTLAHDWGGLISLGWALEHRHLLEGILLTNTGVYHDSSEKIPAALQLALNPAVHGWGTQNTTTFLDVTLHLAQHGGLSKEVYRTFAAPYTTKELRQGIRNFVADIPAYPGTASHSDMVRIAEGIRELEVPAFFQWGTKDPVFQRRYMADLQQRLPQADVHRYEKASHLVGEDEDIATPIFDWLEEHFLWNQTARETHLAARAELSPAPEFVPMLTEIRERAQDISLAIVDMDSAKETEVAATKSWAELAADISTVAQGLREVGVKAGDRVNLMVPPGAKLTTLIYACMSLGAVIVVADTGLGAKGLTRALKGARPDFLVGIRTALVAAKSLGWPGTRIAAESLPAPVARALGVKAQLTDFVASQGFEPAEIHPDDDAAVLYTSGSTGPAKGVVYTHRQLAGMRDAIRNTYNLKAGTGLVAGFAPFALLGPALGATSVTPTMDVTQPKTLTATALASATQAINATTIFASPAALMNVVRTCKDLTSAQKAALGSVEVLLSAGAPLAVPLLEAVQSVVPQASIHTPYGMTEALPITDVSFEEIKAAHAEGASGAMAHARDGVCVGKPVFDAQICLAPLDEQGKSIAETTFEPGICGEILVAAPHVKDRYDTLWVTEQDSISTPGWHRTGDVGHFDEAGRLWVEGRLGHVMNTSQGILTPVAAEQAAELLQEIRRAAVVAVGPEGSAAVVVVAETDPRATANGSASATLSQKVRAKVLEETGIEVAAVLVVKEHPTDIRHNSKIDRPLLTSWATQVLSGKKARLKK